MTSQQIQFKLWKDKQKLFYNLYNSSINLFNTTLPWKNKKIKYNNRYKLWKKHYKSYLITKNLFIQALNIAIFRDNLILNNLQAYQMISTFKTF